MSSNDNKKIDKKDKTHNDPSERSGFITTFRRGQIGATVWLRDGPEGLQYLTYSLSRWYPPTKVRHGGYSDDFFDYNLTAIQEVSQQAVAFIQQFKDEPEAALEAGRKLNAEKKKRAQARADAAEKPAPGPTLQEAA
jgi:hypothetical protein